MLFPFQIFTKTYTSIIVHYSDKTKMKLTVPCNERSIFNKKYRKKKTQDLNLCIATNKVIMPLMSRLFPPHKGWFSQYIDKYVLFLLNLNTQGPSKKLLEFLVKENVKF